MIQPEVTDRSPVAEFRSFVPQFAGISDELLELIPQPPRRLHQFFERQCDSTPESVALICGNECLSYAELDIRANRLAHYLLRQGAGPNTSVGILLERSSYTYVALLGVLKTGSTFVPIDPSYPADRVDFIAGDAGLSLLVTTSKLAATIPDLCCPSVALDDIEPLLDAMPGERPAMPDDEDDLAYIIYTSGTTGRPKGVAVRHSNICHFLAVCTPIYGVTAEDRVYQGMTIAFDFSIEEIWPTFIAGATLVAGPTDSRRIGPGLADFLIDEQVTVLYCVPTLLATLDRDIPSMRTLIVGGESCPRDLVQRWSRPGCRMLNTYGPTETTVTATWTELEPGKPVTIGRPMPGYQVYVLDENRRPVAPGDAGEICIGGAGVAQGYVNRPDLTAAKFVPDPFTYDRPAAKLYRSGDLGRFAPNGEVEFLGRIDSQVKIRGYRIELSEIEAVLLEDSAVENAIVSTTPAGGPPQDLVAYITLRAETPVDDLKDRLSEVLRRRLPVYMVPAFIEVLDRIPMLPSGKADRKQLPAPTSPRLSARSTSYVAPEGPLQIKLAEAWHGVFGHDGISANADFFLDLGGHSLFAAQLISKLRNDPELRRLSIADLYSHPSIRTLARHLEESASPQQARVQPDRPVCHHNNLRVWGAGAIQFGFLYALLAILGAPIAILLAEHATENSWMTFGIWDMSLPGALMILSLFLPVVLKWTLIGRFRAGTHPLWGWYYCRWWLVRKALELSPIRYLAGSPLLSLYARMLGARVGRGCHIATPQLHLPDLIEIGEGVSIGYEAELHPFVIEDGWLHMAPIRIGAGAFIGAKSVVMLGSAVGRGARIGEQTLVTRDQEIPDGEDWSGSPASPAATSDSLLDQMAAKPIPPITLSGWLWVGFAAGFVLLEMLPLLIALPGVFLIAYAEMFGGPLWGFAATPLAGLMFTLMTCGLVAAGKKLLMPHARPGFYPIHSAFGLRKWLADQFMATSLTLTNTLYATLYTLPWLRLLGARIGRRSEVSTVSHIDPDLLVLGSETFVADIASVGAATFYNGYVALGRTQVGDRTFLGNAAVIRSHTQLPDNCLIGVQSVAPAEPAKPGTSWLGSPAIFLPRRQICESFGESLTYRPPKTLVAYRLAIEFLRVVLPPTLLYVLGEAVILAGIRVFDFTSTPVFLAAMPALVLAVASLITLLIAGLKWLIVGRYRSRVEPLWAPFVRHSELITGLYESFTVPMLAMLLTGTPWIAPVLRIFGVRVGKRVYLESTYITEFDLVRLGDDASIGRATSLQTHLFEDRVMKMSTVNVGPGCTVGPRAVVLYDSTIHAGARLDGLSLAMKGESIPAATWWRGIPARLVE